MKIKSKMKFIIGILIGMIIAGGIGAYAEYKYIATQIEYKDGKSVDQALNELYGIKTNEINTLEQENSDLSSQVQTLITQISNVTNAGASGNFNVTSASTSHTETIGFRPSKIILQTFTTDYYIDRILDYSINNYYASWGPLSDINNYDYKTSEFLSSNGNNAFDGISVTLNNNGFTINVDASSNYGQWYWYAIK